MTVKNQKNCETAAQFSGDGDSTQERAEPLSWWRTLIENVALSRLGKIRVGDKRFIGFGEASQKSQTF
jgi:hypothetical protein